MSADKTNECDKRSTERTSNGTKCRKDINNIEWEMKTKGNKVKIIKCRFQQNIELEIKTKGDMRWKVIIIEWYKMSDVF